MSRIREIPDHTIPLSDHERRVHPLLLGVDTGGTFTDFALFAEGRLTVHTRLSTPEAPEQAIIAGVTALGLRDRLADLTLIHGSTVATNAVLEGKGVTTAYITNRG